MRCHVVLVDEGWAVLFSLTNTSHKPCDFLAVRPLNWDGGIDDDDEGENWVHRSVPSSGRSHPTHGINNNDGEGEEDKQGGEKGTGKGREQTMGRGNGRQPRTGRGKRRGKGRETVKAKVLLNKP